MIHARLFAYYLQTKLFIVSTCLSNKSRINNMILARIFSYYLQTKLFIVCIRLLNILRIMVSNAHISPTMFLSIIVYK